MSKLCHRVRIRALLSASSIAAVVLFTQPANAQSSPALSQPSPTSQPAAAEPATSTDQAGIADIVVTAERRSESIQKTPLAISAVSGEDLQERQIVNLEALSSQIPNVEFGRNVGDAYIFIRGLGYDSIANGGETRVALYTDNIYQPRTQAAYLGFYDIDRVEVLRGPQGTLYGRNATAGAINILSREPEDQFSGYLTGRVGNYGLVGTEGAVGGPLSETVSARIAFQTQDHSGYGENIGTGEAVNDQRTRSVRAKLKFAPSSNFSYRIEADYNRQKDHSAGYRFIGPVRPGTLPLALRFGGTVPTDPQDSAGYGPRFSLEAYGVAGEGRLSLGPSTDIVSVTGFRRLTAQTDTNVDGSTLNLSQGILTDRASSFSQELRLSQKIGDFADLLLGGFYYHENGFSINKFAFSGGGLGLPADFFLYSRVQGRLITNAYAAFGQARIHVLPTVTLTVGGRYSHETKSIDDGAELDLTGAFDINGAFAPYATRQAKTSLSRFDPKVTLEYSPNRNLFFYATYSRGYKAGGFNIGGLQPAFQPEVLDDYEAGVKLDLFDRRLRLNVAAFHYDYSNLQVNIPVNLQLVTLNAASAKVDGAEAEITILPVDNLRIQLNGSYLNGRYEDFVSSDPNFPEMGDQNLKGNRLNYSPKWKLNGEIGYTFATGIGGITPRVNVTWTDRVFFSQFNTLPLSQGSRTNVDLSLAYESPNGLWSASAFIKNLTDKTYVVSASAAGGGFNTINGGYGAPRTFGLSATRKF